MTAFADSSTWRVKDWLILGFLLAGAAALRLLFFNGYFGSDDLTYLQRSLQIAQGVWSPSDYNGALRYGYNIPSALPIAAFGLNPLSATLWPFICSLMELVAVYMFAAAFIGRRAAIYATVLLATTPLHIALPTRVHADAVLACFLSLSFVLFYAAERGEQRVLYLLAGLAMGMVFWVKELALVALLPFLTYPLMVRRLDRKWLWTVAGGGVMLVGHLILMQAINGDPLHVAWILAQFQKDYASVGVRQDSAFYYFNYLLFDIKHTFLLGYLSIAALVFLAVRRVPPTTDTGRAMSAYGYVAWWLLALLFILSWLPVSLHPLRLVMKQSNYLNLFLAPMAILGGAWLARLSSARWRIGVLAVAVLGGVGLGAAEQATYQVFTANSKAAVEMALAHPQAVVAGSVSNWRMALVRATIDNDPILGERFVTLADRTAAERLAKTGEAAPVELLAIVDRETQNWKAGLEMPVTSVPECWVKVGDLHPLGMGLGADLFRGVRAVVDLFPAGLANRVDVPLSRLVTPEVATVYRVNGGLLWCGGPAPVPLGQQVNNAGAGR